MSALRIHSGAAIHVPRPSSVMWRPDHGREYPQDVNDKPKGLWWGVGRGWMEWCEEQQFGPGGYVYRLDLNRRHILEITSRDDLRRFSQAFGAPAPWPMPEICADPEYFIDWPRVAERWAGIQIAPYLPWNFLLGPRWYWGWDCASGCAWDLHAAIAGVEYLGEWTVEELGVLEEATP